MGSEKLDGGPKHAKQIGGDLTQFSSYELLRNGECVYKDNS